MELRIPGRARLIARSLILFAAIAVLVGGLAVWKFGAIRQAEAAATNQPEPVEVVTGAVAAVREHREVTTSIGTVLATRSVTLRNELPGTVRQVRLTPGGVVEAGTVLIGLDVSVEEAELEALLAQAELAESTLGRVQRMAERQAASAIELDEARAARDVALAQIERTRAIIERKTIRAPFRARIGISDVHPGQFLESGTLLTTLQGVDDAAHVDFAVAQAVASSLEAGDVVEVFAGNEEVAPIRGTVVAIDSRVDRSTRNATVRARIDNSVEPLTPGASVRVSIPVRETLQAVAVPVSALRKGPGGDHVFLLEAGEGGQTRAHVRQVQAGPVFGDEVMILAGLNGGDTVATSGSFKLREGALVQIAGDAVARAEGAR
ncbi:MAG: efflux RND transporter periplasmic adaptor subunit [Gemmatimonas sp.]|nr:efflux RND transporter periplasmic adaptor subunit [Gemmatimonas sp.]